MAEAAKLNPMEMSDEDISNMTLEQLERTAEASSEPEEGESEGEAPESSEEPVEASESEEEYEEEEAPDEDPTEPRDVYSGADSSAEEIDTEELESAQEAKPEASGVIDYKAEYEKLLSPFKANKKEMKVESVDEALHLMQMGVGYSEKMRDLKNDLRIVKTLKKNNLFDSEKINFLIDLDKGTPEAVTKFLKDNNIDPLELDLESETPYKPQTYTVSESEYNLDSTLDDIQGTETFERTIQELGSEDRWDKQSKEFLMKYPDLIRTINDQIGDGTYDQIWSVIERERMFGRLVGTPGIEAYKMVGEALAANGTLKQGNKPVAKPKNKPQNARLAQRKRAASPTRGTPAKSKGKPNMLGLSDDEFEKMSVGQFS